ncbi:transposable element Tc3 transposase [Trichonephila clavipes]|nr:transposable element Tc3 transposase [Trichonephila clavipes]
MDRCDASHPFRCTTAHDDRKIVRMLVIDRAATSGTTAQQIQSIMHHSVSTVTNRLRFQQSGPLFHLPFIGNHRCLHRQWCDERRTWTMVWNGIVFPDQSRLCLQHHDGWNSSFKIP